MNTNKISTRIKMLGGIFVFLMIAVIATTLYLNDKNKKDALIINIAGKERMLTQKISKNIFYLYHNNQIDYSELDNATEEFIYNLNSLKIGNTLTGITPVPTDEIAKQISKVEILWNSFHNNIQRFKELQITKNESNSRIITNVVNAIYNTNNHLLNEVDKLVTMYTIYSENKTESIKNFQFIAAIVIIFLIGYSFSQLRNMESNARKFLEFSKQLVQTSPDEHMEPIQLDAEEKEIQEATDTLNCFIGKVNSAMDDSAVAIAHSKNASAKLEEITDEFDKILDDLENSTDIHSHLNKSEDMVIESTEELINSTHKLQKLKKELDKLLQTCTIK